MRQDNKCADIECLAKEELLIYDSLIAGKKLTKVEE